MEIKAQVETFSNGLAEGDPTNEEKIAEHKAKLEREIKEGKASAAASKKAQVALDTEVAGSTPPKKPQAQEAAGGFNVNTTY